METGAKEDAAVAAKALCSTKHRLVGVLKCLTRRATKVVSHADPTTVLLIAPAKTQTANLLNRTLEYR